MIYQCKECNRKFNFSKEGEKIRASLHACKVNVGKNLLQTLDYQNKDNYQEDIVETMKEIMKDEKV